MRMLKNDFYTVHELQSSLSSLSCIVVFDKSHAVFEGHFPGQPVVPGVCMIQMVRELLEQQLSQPLFLRQAAQVKFLRLITPDISPEIHISWAEAEGKIQVSASFKKDGDLFKFSGLFEPAAN